MIAQAPQSLPDTARRRRYHFHVPGLFYIIVTFFLAVGAINSQNNLLFASLGLAIGGLLMSGILSGGSLIGIRCERAGWGDVGSVGRPLRLSYRIRNANRLFPAFGLSVVEHIHRSGGENWRRFVARPSVFVSHIAGKDVVEVSTQVVPRVRGLMRVRSVRVSTTFPFGLARKSISFELPASVVVHPVDLPVGPGLLKRLAVRASSGTGSAMSPGLGDDFYGLREYQDGDSPRWIAWRRSARTGQMVVRQNTTPTPRQLWIVVRLSELGAESRLNERAIAIAASLIRAAAREGAAVGLAVPRASIAMKPQSSRRSIRAMLERLATLDLTTAHGSNDLAQDTMRTSARVVIHAGLVDHGMGGSRAFHVSAADPGDLLQAGHALTRGLALLDAPFGDDVHSLRESLVSRVQDRLGVGGRK